MTDVIGMYARARAASAHYGMSCEEGETVTEPDEIDPEKAAPQDPDAAEPSDRLPPLGQAEVKRGVEQDRARTEEAG